MLGNNCSDETLLNSVKRNIVDSIWRWNFCFFLEELCCITENMAQSFNLIPGQKLCCNCREKLTNIEEENFDKEDIVWRH